MRLLLLLSFLVLICFFKSNASLCYVKNSICKKPSVQTGIGNVYFFNKGECGIACKVKDKDNCDHLSGSPDKSGELVFLAAEANHKERSVHFNATIKDYSWKKILVRIYRSCCPDVSICRSYKAETKPIPGYANLEFKIHNYDLMLSDYPLYESKRIKIEMTIEFEKRKKIYAQYIFKAPSFNRFTIDQINEVELFNYIDFSEDDSLKLIVQEPAQVFIPKYSIEVWKNKNELKSNKTMVVPRGSTTDIKQFNYTYKFDEDNSGDYYFIITPNTVMCGNYGCHRTFSADVSVGGMGWVLWAIIAGVVLLVFIIIAILICCCCSDALAWCACLVACCSCCD